MKYWRYRMYLLPRDDPAMKKILEGAAKRCDIYTDNKPFLSENHICNEFVRFVELHLNKIKKVTAKKPRVRNSYSYFEARSHRNWQLCNKMYHYR